MTDPAVARRNASARRRGKAFESDLRNALREDGLDVETLRQTGTNDEGDLVVKSDVGHFILEAKAEATYSIPQYIREADLEAENFAKHRPGLDVRRVFGVAVMKARGKSLRESYVVLPLRTFIRLVLLLGGRT